MVFYQFVLDSNIVIHAVGKHINDSEFGLDINNMRLIEDVDLLLSKLDAKRTCQGVLFCSSLSPDIKTSFGPQYVNSKGQLRHVNCTVLLENDEE